MMKIIKENSSTNNKHYLLIDSLVGGDVLPDGPGDAEPFENNSSVG